MTSIRLAITALLLSSGLSHAQASSQTRHSIGKGESFESRSQPYTAKVPYILKWHAEKTYNPDKEFDPTWTAKVKSTEVFVFEAGTPTIIARSGKVGLDGELKVPVAGRHEIKVFTRGKWEAWFDDDASAPSRQQPPKDQNNQQSKAVTSDNREYEELKAESDNLLKEIRAEKWSRTRTKAVAEFDKMAAALGKRFGGDKERQMEKITSEYHVAAMSAGSEEELATAAKNARFKMENAGLLPGAPKPSSDPNLPPGMERRSQGKAEDLKSGKR